MENEIYDIYTISDIAILPLAIGYYYLIVFFILIILAILLIKKIRSKNNLHRATKKELTSLLNEQTTNDEKIYLLIKKMALYKFNRKDVASLSGEELLSYLDKNDPAKFAWSKEASFIKNLFSPKSNQEINNFDNIITNLKKWL